MTVDVALRGNLRDFGIGEVFQLIGQQRKTGILEVDGSSERIHVWFDHGAVVSAATVGPHDHAALGDMLVRVGLLTPDRLVELEREREAQDASLPHLLVQLAGLSPEEIEEVADLVTRETIFTLLRWTRGSFHFTAQHVQHGRAPSRLLPAETILIDGLRMVDEWRTLEEAATSEVVVFQRVGSFESYRDSAAGEPPERVAAAEKLYLLIDGRLATRRVTDLSRLGTFEAARLLSGMLRAGVIEPLDAAALARSRRRRALDLAPARTWASLLAAIPFVLLVAVVWLTYRATPDASIAPGFAIARDPMTRVEQRFETLRLRNLAEAYRFATGAWPRDLAELARRGWVSQRALASRTAGPYYYVHREEGPIVLAPEL